MVLEETVKPVDKKLLAYFQEELTARISETNFGDPEQALRFRNSEIVRQVLVEAYKDSRIYNKVFYGDRFRLDFSPMHDTFYTALDAKDEKGEPKYKKIVVKAFRGFGKSTTAQAILGKRIRFQDTMLATYIGKNEGFSIDQCENTKQMLMASRFENFIFGELNMKLQEGTGGGSFSKKSWITTYGTKVVPRGAGQPVRGMLHIGSVPDGMGGVRAINTRVGLFIVDDLEDDKLVDNEEWRNELYQWVIGHVLEAKPLPGESTNWQMIYIDTLKHQDAVLDRLMKRDDWLALDLPLCDQNYKSFAPAFYPDEDIKKEVEEHRKANTLDVFYQEKMGIPIALETAAFKKEYFRYYAEDDNVFENGKNFRNFRDEREKLETVVIVDPAKTVNTSSAETGFAVVSFNVYEHRIFIRFAGGEKLPPEKIYDRAFELAARFNARVIGYEETSLNEFIRKPFTDAMLSQGLAYELIPLKARSGHGEFSGHHGGKKARIASMVSYYKRGEVYHNIVGCEALEVQLMSFPKSKRWDVMDATAYFVEMLDKGGRFWLPPGMLEESAESIEREYADLEREDQLDELIDDWRTI